MDAKLLKDREQVLLSEIERLDREEADVVSQFEATQASGEPYCCEDCEIGRALDSVREERAPLQAELEALRREHGGVVVVDYRRQCEADVSATPGMRHLERLPERDLAPLLDSGPLTCFLLHRSNEEVMRAVVERHHERKWDRPIVWFTGEVDCIKTFFEMPLVPRDLVVKVLLPVLRQRGYEAMLRTVERCKVDGYQYGQEDKFVNLWGSSQEVQP